jgi:hypothetical protein
MDHVGFPRNQVISQLHHNCTIKTDSYRLGYVRTSITTDVYGHLSPNIQDEVAEMIDNLVAPTEVKLARPITIS